MKPLSAVPVTESISTSALLPAAGHACPGCGTRFNPRSTATLCPACLMTAVLSAEPDDAPVEPDHGDAQARKSFSEFELLGEVGRGGMGVVYRARQRGVNRLVALKLLQPGRMISLSEVQRFQQESGVIARLEHPGILPLYSAGEHQGQPWCAVKWMDGGSLAQRMSEFRLPAPGRSCPTQTLSPTSSQTSSKPPPPSSSSPFLPPPDDEEEDPAKGRDQDDDEGRSGLEVRVSVCDKGSSGARIHRVGSTSPISAPTPASIAVFLRKLALAIHHAHQRGVLHRDLKPGNILLDSDNEPAIADFGLARTLDSESALTRTGSFFGSPAYTAPEQAASDGREVTVAADIYGLGGILYELLTGQPPFTGKDTFDTLRHVVESAPTPPRALNPNVPADIETICLKCLEKEPAKRYATAQALADDLERFLNNEPILARPVTRLERALRWCRRKPALASAYGLLLLLLLLLSIASPIAAFRIDQARQEAVHQARQARLNQYVADINLAAEALQTRHSPGRARELLTGLIPETGEDLRGWEWHYLWGQVQSDATYTLGEHPDNIRSLALSPSGTLLASSDWGGAIGLWDLESRERLLLRQERQTVHQVQFYSDQILVAANASGSVTFHRVADGKLLHKIEVGAAVHAISLTPARDRLAALFSNNQLATVRVWHLRSADSPDVMLAIEPAYDLPTVREQRGWLGRNAVAFSPSGRQLSAGYSDGTIRIFDVAKGAELRRLVGHTQAIGSLAWSSDGRWLASGAIYGDHEAARVWDTTTGEVLATLAVPQRTPRYVAFTRDDRYLLVARSGGNLQVWRTADWSLARVLLGHEHHVNAIVTGPTVDTVFSGGDDRRILAWNLAQPSKQPATLELPGLRAFDWSPLGDVLATVETAAADPNRRGVFIRATRNLQTRRELPELTDVPLDLAFSPAGQRLAVLTPESVSVMDLAAGRLHRSDPLPETGSTLIAGFTSDGEALLLLAPDLRVTVWDVRQGTVRHTWSARLDRPQWSRLDKWTVSFHAPSGLLALTVNRCLSLWDTGNHAHLADLHGDTSSTVHPAFSSDGSLIVSADTDGRINVWNAQTLTLRQELRRLEDSAFSAAVSPDARRVAVGRYRGEISTVTLVDIETGRELLAIPGAPGLVRQLAWSPDGSVLLARMDEGRAWVIPPGSLRPDN